MKVENFIEENQEYSLEQIFHEWIDYLIDIGRVKRENVNWKLLNEAIVELEYKGYINAGRKLH
jgi:hypothetical protein|tara:strand:- start:98 stop:286 length:189 start_codon:yes stop_codon:yes gene_type:complete